MREISIYFVILSGIYDLALGLFLIGSSRRDDPFTKAVWASFITLGGFLLFAGVVLIWAAFDLTTRGPVVAWQGLLRFGAASAIFYALKQGYVAESMQATTRGAGIIDVIVGFLYFVILLGVWHWPMIKLLSGG
jgi:hypothetical protein